MPFPLKVTVGYDFNGLGRSSTFSDSKCMLLYYKISNFLKMSNFTAKTVDESSILLGEVDDLMLRDHAT